MEIGGASTGRVPMSWRTARLANIAGTISTVFWSSLVKSSRWFAGIARVHRKSFLEISFAKWQKAKDGKERNGERDVSRGGSEHKAEQDLWAACRG